MHTEYAKEKIFDITDALADMLWNYVKKMSIQYMSKDNKNGQFKTFISHVSTPDKDGCLVPSTLLSQTSPTVFSTAPLLHLLSFIGITTDAALVNSLSARFLLASGSSTQHLPHVTSLTLVIYH